MRGDALRVPIVSTSARRCGRCSHLLARCLVRWPAHQGAKIPISDTWPPREPMFAVNVSRTYLHSVAASVIVDVLPDNGSNAYPVEPTIVTNPFLLVPTDTEIVWLRAPHSRVGGKAVLVAEVHRRRRQRHRPHKAQVVPLDHDIIARCKLVSDCMQGAPPPAPGKARSFPSTRSTSPEPPIPRGKSVATQHPSQQAQRPGRGWPLSGSFPVLRSGEDPQGYRPRLSLRVA